ncbi:MAG: hypothetical protein CEO12_239 [Parcubacteria group bacterium Gr01-1014_46]|nr:MAG: hypothetical protein CEO12_239 [Parcubacteria group bacterium Gr01-1014_46]
MNKSKTIVDKIVLWSLVAFCVMGGGLILLDNWVGRGDTPSYTGNLPRQEAKDVVTPDRQQEAVRAMADFMVKDDNVIGLRMWARSLGISAPDFASAATLRENIRRNTDDFSLYRDKKELTRLVETLANQDSMLLEVVNESIR